MTDVQLYVAIGIPTFAVVIRFLTNGATECHEYPPSLERFKLEPPNCGGGGTEQDRRTG
jgi:hypothetical protein